MMSLEKREVFPNRFRYVCLACPFMWPRTPVPEAELPSPPKHSCPKKGQDNPDSGEQTGHKAEPDVKPRPVGICTHCGAISYDTGQLNGRCTEQVAGTRCVGVKGSARREDDWKLCEKCAGSGKAGRASCGYCAEAGWIYTRRRGSN